MKPRIISKTVSLFVCYFFFNTRASAKVSAEINFTKHLGGRTGGDNAASKGDLKRTL